MLAAVTACRAGGSTVMGPLGVVVAIANDVAKNMIVAKIYSCTVP